MDEITITITQSELYALQVMLSRAKVTKRERDTYLIACAFTTTASEKFAAEAGKKPGESDNETYYEVKAGGGKIGIFAANFAAAQAEAGRMVSEGCDAEYCENPDTCTKQHYHDVNCRCEDCFAAEDGY